MKNRFLALAFSAAMVLPAAAQPAPRPVITVDGVVAAAHLGTATRTAISQQIIDLNTRLEQIRDSKPAGEDLKDIHEQCEALHYAIAAQLTPEEQHAFYMYLHAQMEAAGIDVSQFHGDAAHHS